MRKAAGKKPKKRALKKSVSRGGKTLKTRRTRGPVSRKSVALRKKRARRPISRKTKALKTISLKTEEEIFIERVKEILSRQEAPVAPGGGPLAGPSGPLGEAGDTKLIKAVADDSFMEELKKNYESAGLDLIATEVQIGDLPRYVPTRHGTLTEFNGLGGYKEIERYWIQPPYTLAVVVYSEEKREHLYYLVEPSLSPEEHDALDEISGHLEKSLARKRPGERTREKLLSDEYTRILQKGGFLKGLPLKSVYKIWYYLKRDYGGYGEIDALMVDYNIEDISCNGPELPIFLYHRKYSNIRTNVMFEDEERLGSFVATLVERGGKMISLGRPTIDATLPEGSRLQATYGDEITTRGSSFTIRKFAKEPFTPTHLLSYGTYSPEMLAYLWFVTENRKNVMVIGGTASGKTSTLNTIAMFIPPAAKIVSLEETRELTLYQDNWIPNVSRDAEIGMKVSLFDLLKQALRQRPEIMMVGEVRGAEGQTLFQAMSTGHTVYSTMHASSVQEMVNRLEAKPIEVPHQMITAINIVAIQSIVQQGGKRVRRTVEITEVIGMDPLTGGIQTNEVFRWNAATDAFEKVGDSVVLKEIMESRGMGLVELNNELKTREEILRYVQEKNIRAHEEVSLVMRMFYTKPNELMSLIRSKGKGKGSGG